MNSSYFPTDSKLSCEREINDRIGYQRRVDEELSVEQQSWIQVPTSPDEREVLFAQSLNERDPEKKRQIDLLLQCFKDADRNKRNPFKTFVMLLGDTGAGKSTTINNLMNNEMIKTSGKKSETRSVTEYIRKCNVGKLQLSGLEVDIVDTPGFGDTEGLPQDACNLWAIQRFCAETIKAYPNIIVVCMKATENRFEGAKSNFVKCLKILQAMHIIDKEKVNVVIVLTHACALPRRKQRWIEKSSDLANNIKDVLKKELGFSVRVAYIENSIDDYDLDLMDQGSLLPDGTLQPQNLFWVIRDQLKDNGDDLGYLTFEQVYSERMTGKPFLVGNSIDAKIAKDHQDNLDQEENQCLLILQDVAGASDAFKKLKAQFDKISEENERNKKLKEEHNREVKTLHESLEKTNKQMADNMQKFMEERARMELAHNEERRRMEAQRDKLDEKMEVERKRAEKRREEERVEAQMREERFMSQLRQQTEANKELRAKVESLQRQSRGTDGGRPLCALM